MVVDSSVYHDHIGAKYQYRAKILNAFHWLHAGVAIILFPNVLGNTSHNKHSII
jgi:hypothetical protein